MSRTQVNDDLKNFSNACERWVGQAHGACAVPSSSFLALDPHSDPYWWEVVSDSCTVVSELVLHDVRYEGLS